MVASWCRTFCLIWFGICVSRSLQRCMQYDDVVPFSLLFLILTCVHLNIIALISIDCFSSRYTTMSRMLASSLTFCPKLTTIHMRFWRCDKIDFNYIERAGREGCSGRARGSLRLDFELSVQWYCFVTGNIKRWCRHYLCLPVSCLRTIAILWTILFFMSCLDWTISF